MKKILKYILSVPLVFALVSCNEDEVLSGWVADNPIIEASTGDAGTLDFSNYVAIGNSITAGFMDGALFPEGQASSYPSILASQFAMVEGGEFAFPNISSGNGFGGGMPGKEIGRAFIDVAAALLNPADAIKFTSGSALTRSTTASLNNFGVPGARMIDATNALYGLGNPFFANFASAPGTASMLDDAVAANPTFFSVWLGSNDVLGYATSGGVDEADITDAGSFTTSLTEVLTRLSAGGAEGVILNVPPVTLIPYFQIVTTLSGGVNILPAGSIDVATAGLLNSRYGAYNAGLDGLVSAGMVTAAEAAIRKITFVGDEANSPVITDESLTDLTRFGLASMRQAQVINGVSDLFPLTALAVVGTEAVEGDPTTVYGVGVPLPDANTLTVDEQVNIIRGYATFNGIISGVVANFPKMTLVDVGPIFADVFGLSAAQATGLALSPAAVSAADEVLGIGVGGFDLVPLSLEECCLFNSIWSADGIHPNARGAALVANEIIKAINSKNDAEVLEVDVLSFTGINAEL